MKKKFFALLLAALLVVSLVPMTAFAASFSKSEISNPTLYESGCLKTLDVTIQAINEGYAPAYGKIGVHTEASSYSYNNQYISSNNCTTWPETINDPTLVGLSTAEFLWTDCQEHTVTVQFEDGEIPCNQDKTYVVHLWTRAEIIGIYPDHIFGNLVTNANGKLFFGDKEIVNNKETITNGTPESAKETNHGYIAIDKATAAEGETVTVTVTPDEGYRLKTLKYNDGSDHDITKDQTSGNYQFTMPAANVTVTATFDRMYFDLCNGEETLAEKPETDPTWGTYKFVGWYTARTGGTKVETGFTAGTTYYAHWQVSSTDTTLVLTEGIIIKEDGIYVGDEKITDPSIYGLTFTAAHGDVPATLTMNNAVIEAGEGVKSSVTFGSDKVYTGLSTPNDHLAIVLIGENSIRVVGKDSTKNFIPLCMSSSSKKSLTISGSGSLTVDANGSEGHYVMGLSVGNLTNSATLTVNVQNAKAYLLEGLNVGHTLTNSGTITVSVVGSVSNDNAVGIFANNLLNTAGTITGYGATGVYADGIAILAGGSLEITGGKVIGYGGAGTSEYYGLWSGGDIKVSGNGILEVHGGTKQGSDPVALYLEASGKTITVKDNGQIIADADIKNDGTYAGTYAVTGADRDTVSGSVATLKKSGSEDIIINNHTHNLVKVNGQAATETAAGWSDYYECKDSTDACHKYFEDEKGLVPIVDLETWKTGEGAIAKLVHTITPVSAQAATQTEAGFKAYYECKNCGKYYEDAEGKNEITDLSAWKAKGGNGYIPSGNEIAAAKTEAKAALDAENAKDPLIAETALTNGKSAIDSAETLADIENAKNNALDAIKNAQKSELDAAKATAKTALDTEEAKDPLTDKTALTNGKNSIDAAGTKAAVEEAKNNAITAIQNAQAAEPVEYKITEGNDAKIEVSDPKDTLFVSDADFSKFVEVLVDNKVVAPENYDAKSGSTDITLKKSYLETLSVGEHTLTIASTDGEASTRFTILQKTNPNPGTGDHTNAVLWIVMMVISFTVFAYCVVIANKKKKDA